MRISAKVMGIRARDLVERQLERLGSEAIAEVERYDPGLFDDGIWEGFAIRFLACMAILQADISAGDD